MSREDLTAWEDGFCWSLWGFDGFLDGGVLGLLKFVY